jgi:hypothetical protein
VKGQLNALATRSAIPPGRGEKERTKENTKRHGGFSVKLRGLCVEVLVKELTTEGTENTETDIAVRLQ